MKTNKKTQTKVQQVRSKNIRLTMRSLGIIALCTFIIVFFFPRNTGLNYSYEIGQPWGYGTLISTQKFNIIMSDSTLQTKKDSLNKRFMPYFSKDEQRVKSIKESLELLSDDEILVKQLGVVLDTIYSHGVMNSHDYDSLTTNGTDNIRVIGGNIANIVPLSSPYTIHMAYKYIMNNPVFLGRSVELRDMNINTILTENLIYEKDKSNAELQQQYDEMSSSLGFVRVNEKIVDRGEIVTPEIYQKLKSYDKVIDQTTADEIELTSPLLWGQIAWVFLLLLSILTYLYIFRPDYFESWRHTTLVYLMITLFTVLASIMVARHYFHILILPCCMIPIIIRVFLDSRSAFFTHVVTMMLISLVLTQKYEFLSLQIVAGVVTVFNLRELTQRSQIIHTAIIITATYVLFYLAQQFAAGAEIKDIDRHILTYFCINGFLLLLTYPVFWILEKTFGLVSDVTLVELSNTNHPLLQKMSSVAPGTFQHSMQVANLASDVAKRIKAKTQLVRTGALYHDIGKLERPVFFTENQAGGNPHKHLPAQKSAEVIIAHVTKGLQLAEKYNLPQQIQDFIRTHHGCGLTRYFLVTYKNEHPNEDVDESLFRYPGPNPETKEQAILMMADAVEAASRSLQEYTEDSISQLVDKIIDTQMNEGYFRTCPITFLDIENAKDVFKERLRIMYHTRISYPELNVNNS